MTDSLRERIARRFARNRVMDNMERERREHDEDFIQRAVDHAWPDFSRDADAALAAIEASGYRLVPPVELPNLDNAEPPHLGPKHFEALAELARYRDRGRRYCWRVASMKKLMAHGLVEHEPGSSQYWEITESGRAALAARPRDISPTDKE